jgi:hypothetical protein
LSIRRRFDEWLRDLIAVKESVLSEESKFKGLVALVFDWEEFGFKI